MQAKLFYMPFNVGDWLKDPSVSSCSPATRGIWFDLLCAMHESGRTGQLTKRADIMCRLGRCSAAELDHALAELQATGAADVTKRNGLVTVTNRRMKREHEVREGARLRKEKSRGKNAGHGHVTNTPEPEPEPEPNISGYQRGAEPVPKPVRRSGSGVLRCKGSGLDLNESVLADPVQFDIWCRDEMARPKGFVKSEDDRQFAMAARDKAVSDRTLKNPVGWLKDVLRHKRYDRVPQKHEQRAVSVASSTMDADVAAILKVLDQKRKEFA